jgi:hypothetical protein
MKPSRDRAGTPSRTEHTGPARAPGVTGAGALQGPRRDICTPLVLLPTRRWLCWSLRSASAAGSYLSRRRPSSPVTVTVRVGQGPALIMTIIMTPSPSPAHSRFLPSRGLPGWGPACRDRACRDRACRDRACPASRTRLLRRRSERRFGLVRTNILSEETILSRPSEPT